jgi:hypothetical protein
LDGPSWKGNVPLVGQCRWSFPRRYALLEPLKVLVLKLEPPLVVWASVVLGKSARVASHVAEQDAGLPNLELELAFRSWTLSKLDTHQLFGYMMALAIAAANKLVIQLRTAWSLASPVSG